MLERHKKIIYERERIKLKRKKKIHVVNAEGRKEVTFFPTRNLKKRKFKKDAGMVKKKKLCKIMLLRGRRERNQKGKKALINAEEKNERTTK